MERSEEPTLETGEAYGGGDGSGGGDNASIEGSQRVTRAVLGNALYLVGSHAAQRVHCTAVAGAEALSLRARHGVVTSRSGV
jgi:hypothetical protein